MGRKGGVLRPACALMGLCLHFGVADAAEPAPMLGTQLEHVQ
ncbi:MAG TPA: hypothetical protein VF814_03125 [Casimicrobiaceae bacterium]